MKRELPPSFAAARVTVEQLESGPPIGTPIQIRLQGPELATLRLLGDEVKRLMVAFPGTENIHDDWDPESLQINLDIATDRANMSAISNQDVAMMTSARALRLHGDHDPRARPAGPGDPPAPPRRAEPDGGPEHHAGLQWSGQHPGPARPGRVVPDRDDRPQDRPARQRAAA